MSVGTLENEKIEQLLTHLADRLQYTNGKKQYGYLKADLKNVVDEIVDELARDERVADTYALWQECKGQIENIYPQSWQDHSHVALCGVGSQAMHWMLEQNPQLTEVALCLDNDEAGHKAAARMREQLAEGEYTVERLLPNGNDWNDDILMHQQEQTAPAGADGVRRTGNGKYKFNENLY